MNSEDRLREIIQEHVPSEDYYGPNGARVMLNALIQEKYSELLEDTAKEYEAGYEDAMEEAKRKIDLVRDSLG